MDDVSIRRLAYLIADVVQLDSYHYVCIELTGSVMKSFPFSVVVN